MRTRTLIVVGIAVIGVAAACGAEPTTKVTVGTVMASVASKSESLKTFHFTQEGDGETTSGEVNLATQSLEVTTTNEQSPAQVPGQGGTTGGPSGVTVPALPVPSTTTIIEIGDTVWVQGVLPGPDSKQWTKITGEAGSDAPGESPFFDPSKLFDEMKAHVSDIHTVGTATIGGVLATEYQGSLSNTPGNAGLSGSQGSDVIDVWTDGSGLVRQARFAFKMSAGSDSPDFNGAITIDFTDYGQPVNIMPPPASEVTEIPSITVNTSNVEPPTTVPPKTQTSRTTLPASITATTTGPAASTGVAAGSEYEAAKVQWLGSGLDTGSAGQNAALPIAINDLRIGESTDPGSKTGYPTAIAMLEAIGHMPDAMISPQEGNVWNADTAALDRFFAVPQDAPYNAVCAEATNTPGAAAWNEEPAGDGSGVVVGPLKQAAAYLQQSLETDPCYRAGIDDLTALESATQAEIAQTKCASWHSAPSVLALGAQIGYLNQLFEVGRLDPSNDRLVSVDC